MGNNAQGWVKSPGWIPYDGSAGGHVFRDDGPHADRGAVSDSQRLTGAAVPQGRARADVNIVSNMHVAVDRDSRPKGHKVAHHAVMRDITLQVRMKVPAYANTGGVGKDRLCADDSAFAEHHPIIEFRTGGDEGMKAWTPHGNASAYLAISYGEDAKVIAAESAWSNHRQASEEGRRVGIVVGKDGAIIAQAVSVLQDLAAKFPPEAAGAVDHQSGHKRHAAPSRRSSQAEIIPERHRAA